MLIIFGSSLTLTLLAVVSALMESKNFNERLIVIFVALVIFSLGFTTSYIYYLN
jgi:hypothetical protein